MRPKKIYMVWDTREDDEGCRCYLQFDSIEEAVHEFGDGVEVFEATPKSIGHYALNTKVTKVKKPKEGK